MKLKKKRREKIIDKKYLFFLFLSFLHVQDKGGDYTNFEAKLKYCKLL